MTRLTGPCGIFTRVLVLHFHLRRKRRLGSETVDAILDGEALADVMGLPNEWIICPSCNAQSWRFPPHSIGDPCPLVERTTEQIGMKLDAERMALIRGGVQQEQMVDIMRRITGMEEEAE